MARDTPPSPPFDLAYLAKALKCAGLGEVGCNTCSYFFITGGIPDDTIFSLFVKVGICSVRNTGIYICLFPMPDEVKHALGDPSDGEKGPSVPQDAFDGLRSWGGGRDFTSCGEGLHAFAFWSSAPHLSRSRSDFLSMTS
jgi:hypothetical protein